MTMLDQVSIDENIIFGNKRCLEEDYIPKHIYMKKEFIDIIKEIKKNVSGSIGHKHHLIYGYSGSGKTISLKYLERDLNNDKKSDIKCIYLTCSKYDSSYQILSHLAGKTLKHGVLMDTVQKEYKNSKIIFILDEVEKLQDLREKGNILYFLSRDLPNAIVVLLTNDYKLLDKLNPAVLSSFKPIQSSWARYKYEELQDILNLRIKELEINKEWYKHNKEAFEGAISMICAHTVKESMGDCRSAIKNLYLLCRKIQNQKIQHLNIEKINTTELHQEASINIEKEVLDKIEEDLLILLGSLLIEKKTNKNYDIYNKIYKELRDRIISKTSYFKYLTNLQSSELILITETSVKSGKTGGKSKEVEVLLENKQLVYDVINERLDINLKTIENQYKKGSLLVYN